MSSPMRASGTITDSVVPPACVGAYDENGGSDLIEWLNGMGLSVNLLSLVPQVHDFLTTAYVVSFQRHRHVGKN